MTTEKQAIEEVLKGFRGAPGKLDDIVKNFETYPEGKKVLKSLIRQEKERAENWPLSFKASGSLLLMKCNNWFYESQHTPLRPKERQEAIDRIAANAMNVFMDLASLGLPINSFKYFTQQELFERYQQLFAMFDLPDELTKPGYVNYEKHLKPYLEMYWGSYPKSDVLILDLLMKLADRELLNELAAPAIVSKTESENFPRVFMIRKLAGWFTSQYGKTLQNTIANLCVLIFEDTDIDRDTVRSALSGFEIEPEKEWFSEGARIILDKPEPGGG